MALQLQKEAEDCVKALTLLDGSHLHIASDTAHYKAKFTHGKQEEESVALLVFITQFTLVNYREVRNLWGKMPGMNLFTHNLMVLITSYFPVGKDFK